MQHSLKLSESQKKFYQYTKDVVLVTDLNGNIHFANNSFYTLTGNNEQDFIHRHFDTLQCENPLMFSEAVRKVSIHHVFITRLKCKSTDEKIITFPASFSFLKDQELNPTGILIVLKNNFIDLTREENFLKIHTPLLRSLNFRTDEMCMVYDVQNWRNIYCTDTVEKILGWTANDFINGGWAFGLATTHKDDNDNLTDLYQQEMSKRKDPKSGMDKVPLVFEYRKIHKNGSFKWIRSESIILERNEDGNISYMAIFIKDISSEKLKSKIKLHKGLDQLLQNGLENLHLGELNLSDAETVRHFEIHLSRREKEILEYVKKGLSTKQIASRLSLAANTINTYRKKLMIKLHAKNTAELVKNAMELNIT